MAITISGDGSITGLAVGGLPDGTVDNDTITGGKSIADVPAWVQEEVAKVLFAEQLQAYKVATARLEAYVLADGRVELTEMQDTRIRS